MVKKTIGNNARLTSDGSPEDLGGRPEVERTASRLYVAAEPQEPKVLELVAIEVPAHVDALAAHNDDLVAVEHQLGHHGGQPAQQMAAGVDHHGLQGGPRS